MNEDEFVSQVPGAAGRRRAGDGGGGARVEAQGVPRPPRATAARADVCDI